jgi:hypothetical protein
MSSLKVLINNNIDKMGVRGKIGFLDVFNVVDDQLWNPENKRPVSDKDWNEYIQEAIKMIAEKWNIEVKEV